MSIEIKITVTECETGMHINYHCDGECSPKEGDIVEKLHHAVMATLKQEPGHRSSTGTSKRTVINKGNTNVH